MYKWPHPCTESLSATTLFSVAPTASIHDCGGVDDGRELLHSVHAQVGDVNVPPETRAAEVFPRELSLPD